MKLFNKLFTASRELKVIQDNIYDLSVTVNQLPLVNSKLVSISLIADTDTTAYTSATRGYIVVSKSAYADLLTISLDPLVIKANSNCDLVIAILT